MSRFDILKDPYWNLSYAFEEFVQHDSRFIFIYENLNGFMKQLY